MICVKSRNLNKFLLWLTRSRVSQHEIPGERSIPWGAFVSRQRANLRGTIASFLLGMVTEKQSYPRCSTTLWTVTKWKAATPAPGPAHAISPRPGEATTIQKITQRDTAAQDSGTATKKSLGNRGTCSDRSILQRLRPDPAPPSRLPRYDF